MPRVTMTVQQINRSAITPTYVTPDVAGMALPNSGVEVLHIKTGGTGATVTIPIPSLVDGQTVASKSYVLGTSTERMIGPFPTNTYNQASGEVFVDFSSITTVTIAGFRPS